jgi:cytochrome d ubiquinol oxidase subunit II
LSSIDTTTALPAIFALIIAFAIFAYVVMDGFDLGLALLFPLYPARHDRDVMMNSVAPVWDGNETWLVLGGGALFAAFPLAYGIILPALYTPLIAMLLGLVFRGVAFEFRWRSPRQRNVWDVAFFGGSLVAALSQGVALGALLQGIAVDHRHYAGGWWDWLSAFSLLTGVAVVCGYMLLGTCWLILKTEGDLRRRSFRLAPRFAAATLAFILIVSAATPFLEYGYWERWFAWPNILATAPVPLTVVILAGLLFRSLGQEHERAPFILALALFALTFLGLGISLWPYAIPGRITIWQAASPPESQMFMLVGVSILIPIILVYTAYAYWIFRGKVGKAGYH